MTVGFRPARPLPRRFGQLAAAAVLVYFAASTGVRLAVEVLWFEELGNLQVLTTKWTSQGVLWLAGFAVAFAALALGIALALGRTAGPRLAARGQFVGATLPPRRLIFVAAALVAALFGASLAGRWLDFRLLLARVPYGLSDPVFGRDVGFYLFALPALRALVAWGLGLASVCLLATAGVYLVQGAVGPLGIQPRALRHLGVLGALLLLLVGAHFALAQFELLHSPHGNVYGAGYADVKARLPGTRVMSIAALAAAALVVAGAWRMRLRWVGAAPAGLVVLYVLLLGVWPSVIQKLVVEPNELAKEKPYIESAIRLTRAAYDLDAVQAHPFEIDRTLDARTLSAHRDVVDNIRLWDWRPLLATYGQIQEIRLYYNFGDVDIDRYVLNGQYRQVMLSARELAYDQIPEGARTWVNLHLKYTHGYGLCMSPVNRITPEGLPELLVRDIPPVATVDLPILRPEIYFGEQTSVFALVGASTDEFDYPLGETNQSTRYAGKGGIAVGSLGRRLLFAWHLRSREVLLTGYLTPESRILLRRSLRERAPRVAPFLLYDHDPYLVVYDGRLVWVQDAYTASDRFPYSLPVGRLNYLRNSVKVVVDAYDGTTRFYAARPDEPLLRAYAAIFPALFRPLDEMPAGLRAHLRYPEDLFHVQAEIYATYHMQDAQVFYNREDLWQVPIENQGGRETPVEPYYTITRLPDGDRPELVLMLPFTPARKDNMIAWLAARCDGDRLGERDVFMFPKQELVYGPRQVEARIDQDAKISQELTLWSQHGSSVIRGNLLVLPIAHSVLYVEPLYLQAEKGALPELKRVILAHADRIEMGPDLETTLAQLLGSSGMLSEAAAGPPVAGSPAASTPPALGAPGRRALALLRQAETALQKGDWVEYGRSMQELRRYLEEEAKREPANGVLRR